MYRVNGNLSLSRAIGDASERPAISAQPDIRQFLLNHRGQLLNKPPRLPKKKTALTSSSSAASSSTATSSSFSSMLDREKEKKNKGSEKEKEKEREKEKEKEKERGPVFVILASDGLWDVFTSQEVAPPPLPT